MMHSPAITTCRYRRQRRGAATPFDIAAVLLALGLVIFATIGWTRSVRESTRRQLTLDLLSQLNVALDRYHIDTGDYPPSTPEGESDQAIAAMLRVPSVRSLMQLTPPHLWRDGPIATLIDPWSTPLRFVGPLIRPTRVANNGGRPIFVSAGPDRRFGDQLPSELADNIASDDAMVLERTPPPASAPAEPDALNPALTPADAPNSAAPNTALP